MLKLLLIVFLFCNFLQAFASDNDKVEIVNFSEEFNANVESSGGILVGFHVLGSTTTPNFSNLFIARPHDVDSILLSLTTMDGKYNASMELKFKDSQSIWSEVSIPSKLQSILKTYSTDELVAYAYRKEKGKNKRVFHKIFPASWGKPLDENSFEGHFFINSGMAVPRYILNTVEFYCIPTNAEISTAFNKYCELSNNFKKGENLIYVKAGVQRKYVVWRP
jgi:hypothetical protein